MKHTLWNGLTVDEFLAMEIKWEDYDDCCQDEEKLPDHLDYTYDMVYGFEG